MVAHRERQSAAQAAQAAQSVILVSARQTRQTRQTLLSHTRHGRGAWSRRWSVSWSGRLPRQPAGLDETTAPVQLVAARGTAGRLDGDPLQGGRKLHVQ